MTIETVVFDVGETLVDEKRAWGPWADWLNVPRSTFFAVLGATIARGEHHQTVFNSFRPGFNIEHERDLRTQDGCPDTYRASDLYPDVLPCLHALRAQGRRLGIAGNQPNTDFISELNLPVNFVAASGSLGVAKPAKDFFVQVARLAGCAPARIAYVGDRFDNDIDPAGKIGMLPVFIKRGPWACVQAMSRNAPPNAICIVSLNELPEVLGRHEKSTQRALE